MKLIIAGCRDMSDPSVVYVGIKRSGFGPQVTEVISGGAQGVDSVGEALAAKSGLPVKRFNADWKKHGKAAGPIRNRQMAEYGDALLAIWDGESRGTKNMIDEMQKLGKPVYVHRFERFKGCRCESCGGMSTGMLACTHCGSNAC